MVTDVCIIFTECNILKKINDSFFLEYKTLSVYLSMNN